MKGTNGIQSEPRSPSNPHPPLHIFLASQHLPDMLPSMLISKYHLRKLHRTLSCRQALQSPFWSWEESDRNRVKLDRPGKTPPGLHSGPWGMHHIWYPEAQELPQGRPWAAQRLLPPLSASPLLLSKLSEPSAAWTSELCTQQLHVWLKRKLAAFSTFLPMRPVWR